MAPAARRFEAERLAGTLPPLLLAALQVAATMTPGVHGRRRSGLGDSFWQFRHYQPGDPARAIDWRRSARADPVFVRENEWEAAQSVWLWRDASPSMRWRSHRNLPEKEQRAALLLLALAALLLRGGEQVALLGDGAPGRGGGTLTRLAQTLALEERRAARSAEDGKGAGLPPTQALPRHSQLILIGDFLAPLSEVEAALRPFAAGAVRGHLLQVLDPAEEALPMSGRVRFEGMEGEGELLVRRVERLRPDYRQRMAAQKAGLTALARQFGWTFATHHTDKAPQAALLALHAALSLAPEA